MIQYKLALAKVLLHKPETIASITDPVDLVRMLYKLFSMYKPVKLVHYEIIVASMMLVADGPWRTIENRDDKQWQWVSILKVPGQSSWLLGAAFSNLKEKLLEGVIKRRVDNPTSLSNLFRL